MSSFPPKSLFRIGVASGRRSSSRLLSVLCFAVVLMPGCDAVHGTLPVERYSPDVSVAVWPTQASLPPGGKQSFIATVRPTSAAGVEWFVGGVPGGNLATGMINSNGEYTAPSSVPSSGSVTVSAMSLADTSKWASAVVSVMPPKLSPTVSIAPQQAALHPGESVQFTIGTQGVGNPAISWTVNGVPNGSATLGTISSSGLYTAPASISGTSTAVISAQLAQNSLVFANATVTITPNSQPAAGYSWARNIVNSGGDLSYVLDPRLGAPNWGGPVGVGTVWQDVLYNNVKIFRCTDANTDPNYPNDGFGVGFGGSASRVSWSTDDRLLNFNIHGGNTAILYVNAPGHTCSTMCADGTYGKCTAANGLATFGAGFFSKTDPTTFYSWNWDTTHPTTIYKTSLPPPPGGPAPAASAVIDWSPALYPTKQPDWTPGATVVAGQVIEPIASNGPAQNGRYPLFQALNSGRSGAIEPNWSLAIYPVVSGTTYATTFTPMWGIGKVQQPDPDYPGTLGVGGTIIPQANNPSGFQYYVSSCAGSCVPSAQPAWNSACATVGSTCRDGSITWTNAGLSATINDNGVIWAKTDLIQSRPNYVNPIGIENGDDSFGTTISFYGGQDYSVWALIYRPSTQTIYQYNAYTQIETDYKCSGTISAADGTCTGSWTPTIVGNLGSSMTHLGVAVTVHEGELSQNGQTMVITDWLCQYRDNTACGPGGQPVYWTVEGGKLDPTAPSQHVLGHGAIGFSHYMNDESVGGTWAWERSFTDATPIPFLNYSPCGGTNEPPCTVYGAHWSWVHNLGNDQEPIVGTTYSLGQYPANSIFQNEIVGFTTCGLDGEPSCPAGYAANTQYRFGRTFAYQTDHQNFNSWATIGALSQTGQYFALTSTGFCTMGDGNGGNSPVCGWNWSPSHSYNAGETIVPDWDDFQQIFVNPEGYGFKAMSSGSSSASTMPVWCKTPGCTTSDNNITWINVGPSNGRSDVLIYQLSRP